MSERSSADGVLDSCRVVLVGGLAVILLLFLPGIANPFVADKESVVCIVTSFVLLLATVGAPPLQSWPWWWNVVLVAPVAVLTVATACGDTIESPALLRSWSYVAFGLALRVASPRARDAARLVHVATALGAAESVVVLAQVGFGQRLLDLSGLPSVKWHAFGTLGNPNWVGAYLAATLPVAVDRAGSAGGRAARITWWAGATSMVVALVATLSRGAWLAAVVGVAVLIGFAPRRKAVRALAVLLPAVAVAVLLTLSVREPRKSWSAVSNCASVTGRLRMWQVSAAMVMDRPLGGWGAGRFRGAFPSYQRACLALMGEPPPVTSLTDHPHNQFLQLLVDGGAGALISFAAVLWLCLRQAVATRRDGPATPLAAGMVALSTYAMVDVPLQLPATTVLFCLLAVALLTHGAEVRLSRPLRRLRTGDRVALAVVALLVLGHGVRVLFVDGRLAAARRALAAGEVSEAERLAGEALRLDSRQGELWAVLARARAARGDDEGAGAAVRRAQKLAPSPKLWYLLAEIEERRGRTAESLAALRVMSETLPGLLRPRLLLAERYAASGDRRRAERQLRILLSTPLERETAEALGIRERARVMLEEIEHRG